MSNYQKVKLSIIIPIYNVGSYIKRCINSILNQSFKEIEIIVINDASTDNTDLIIQELLINHPINYIKLPENKGAGNARNIGLGISNGQYISFIDGDDWIDSNYYNIMISSIEKTGSDIAVSGTKTEFGSSFESIIRYKYDYENVITNEFAINLLSRVYSQDSYITPIVCSKIFKSSLLKDNNLLFAENSFSEDDIFTFLSFVHAKSIVIVPNTYYHYYQRQNSITHTFSKKHIDDLVNSFIQLRSLLNNSNAFHMYKDSYWAFFKKCIQSNLSMIFKSEQNIVIQKKFIAYFAEVCLNSFTLSECIELIDINNLKLFFNLQNKVVF